MKSLSPTAEFLIVVIGAFALPITTSLWFNIAGGAQDPFHITDQQLLELVVQEIVTLSALVWFLNARGWHVDHFAAVPSWREGLHALALIIATYAAWIFVWQLLNPGPVPAAPVYNLNWAAVLALSIINPLFEEVFLCAYMLPFLIARRGVGTALAVSLAVRVAFHTYQGPLGMLSIACFGLIVSAYYARTRRLWPVLITHGVLDFVAFV